MNKIYMAKINAATFEQEEIVKMCIFNTKNEAETWLQEQCDILEEDLVLFNKIKKYFDRNIRKNDNSPWLGYAQVLKDFEQYQLQPEDINILYVESYNYSIVEYEIGNETPISTEYFNNEAIIDEQRVERKLDEYKNSRR